MLAERTFKFIIVFFCPVPQKTRHKTLEPIYETVVLRWGEHAERHLETVHWELLSLIPTHLTPLNSLIDMSLGGRRKPQSPSWYTKMLTTLQGTERLCKAVPKCLKAIIQQHFFAVLLFSTHKQFPTLEI